MADSFGGSIAENVKAEQKNINTLPMAKWEDVGRIRSQTWNMAGLRMWQIAALLFTLLAWAYTTYSYRHAEVIMQNDLTNIVNAGIIVLCLLFFAVLVIDIRRDVVDDGAQWILIGVVTLFAVAFIFAFTPIATWAILNTISIGLAPIKQIIFAGWVPVVLSIIALSIVPDFQIGRFAWWRELTNQPAASSEKQVIDVTAIRLKEMELEAKHDEMTDAERAEYETRIAELEERIEKLVESKPVTRLVPFNHGTARSINGAEYTESEWGNFQAFLSGWTKRGISRDAWTTEAAERKYGTRIPQPDWEKFRDTLHGLGIYDANNRPTMSAEDAAKILKIELL